MTELKINPEYEAIWEPLPKAEYKALKASIESDGLLEPIRINDKGIILDGHNRYRACKDLGMTPEYTIIQPENELIYIIRTQLNRRHASIFKRIENAIPLIEIERERAKDRQGTRTDLTLSKNLDNVGKTNEIIGGLIGISHETVRQALYIVENGSEEDKIAVRRGTKRIHPIFLKNWNTRQREKPRPPLPEGVYDVIYADPPWSYTYKGTTRGVATSHYPTMQLEDIVNLQVYGVPITDKIADDAILFLWVTNPFLEKAFEVVNGWGFTYKTSMAWVKPHIGLGYYVRSQHENLYVCLKGDVKAPAEADRHSSIIEAPNPRHSEKPEKVYDIIEKMYPNRKYLELFARGKPRMGWTFWGDETK